MLEVKDLKVAYGRVQAVKGISFKVDQGQVVTLLGTNGAGKTTTLRTISGLIRPESGEIWFEGERIDADTSTSGPHPRSGAFTGGSPDLPEAHRRGESHARRVRAQGSSRRQSRISNGSSISSTSCGSDVRSRPARSPVASSRCWRSVGP